MEKSQEERNKLEKEIVNEVDQQLDMIIKKFINKGVPKFIIRSNINKVLDILL
jgi:hypothetical protein